MTRISNNVMSKLKFYLNKSFLYNADVLINAIFCGYILRLHKTFIYKSSICSRILKADEGDATDKCDLFNLLNAYKRSVISPNTHFGSASRSGRIVTDR